MIVLQNIIYFPVWLRNRLISAGLEPVLRLTEKSCIASNYRQFFTNIEIKIIKVIPVLFGRAFGPSGLTKEFKSCNFSFNNNVKNIYNTMR